jgi:hypothetical protein
MVDSIFVRNSFLAIQIITQVCPSPSLMQIIDRYASQGISCYLIKYKARDHQAGATAIYGYSMWQTDAPF